MLHYPRISELSTQLQDGSDAPSVQGPTADPHIPRHPDLPRPGLEHASRSGAAAEGPGLGAPPSRFRPRSPPRRPGPGKGRCVPAAYLGGRHHRDLLEVVVRHAGSGAHEERARRVATTLPPSDASVASFPACFPLLLPKSWGALWIAQRPRAAWRPASRGLWGVRLQGAG